MKLSIRDPKTGAVLEVTWNDWIVIWRSRGWERIDDGSAGVAAMVPTDDGPPPLEAEKTLVRT